MEAWAVTVIGTCCCYETDGREKEKVLPLPGVLSHHIFPEKVSTIARQIESPRPVEETPGVRACSTM